MSANAGPAAPEGLDDLIRSRIENLRPKLLDLTRRNPLISTRLSPRSNSLVRVVDELPDVIASYLAGEQRMRLVPLPPLENDPRDEQSRAFQDALSNARLTDEVYITGIQELKEKDDDESAEAARRLERELRDRIRADLGMGVRQIKGDLRHVCLHLLWAPFGIARLALLELGVLRRMAVADLWRLGRWRLWWFVLAHDPLPLTRRRPRGPPRRPARRTSVQSRHEPLLSPVSPCQRPIAAST